MGSTGDSMKLVTLLPWLLLGPLIVLYAPQFRQRLGGRQRQGALRGRGRGGSARLNVRQNQVGRQVPALPEPEPESEEVELGEEFEYDGGYEAPARYTEEQPSGYGYTRDSNEYVERRGGGGGSAQGRESSERGGYEESGYRREGREENEGRGQERTVEETLQSSEEETGEEGDCGTECRNLMHESEHPKEADRCPYEGMVIDIWGYCRYQFEEERRDWRWWETIRQYMHANGNSWANQYAPTVHQQMYHQG